MYKTHLNDRVIIGASLGTLLESSQLKNLKYTSQLLCVSRQDCKRTSQLGSFTFVLCLKYNTSATSRRIRSYIGSAAMLTLRKESLGMLLCINLRLSINSHQQVDNHHKPTGCGGVKAPDGIPFCKREAMSAS